MSRKPTRRHHRPAQSWHHQGRRYLHRREPLKFTGIPSFAAEHFRRVRLKNPLKSKQLEKGLTQLAEEGAIQVFRPLLGNDYIVGAVGVLQFDVTMDRLRTSTGLRPAMKGSINATARWVSCGDAKKFAEFERKNQAHLAHDAEGTLAFLAPSEWRLGYVAEQWPEIYFAKTREHQ